MKNKEEEFDLSDKRRIIFDNDKPTTPDYQYHEQDVKEFIKKLKEELSKNDYAYCGIAEELIDKLAGEKLR